MRYIFQSNPNANRKFSRQGAKMDGVQAIRIDILHKLKLVIILTILAEINSNC